MKTVDELKNAYTHYLKPNLGKIYFMSKSNKISLDRMKQTIKNYIYPATYSYVKDDEKLYTKKKEFMDNVMSMTDKAEISKYCYNSVRKAEETEVNR